MKVKIIIDPTTNILYSAYYLKGLYQFFGKRNVRFACSMKFFKDLKRKEVPYAHDQYLAFVIVEDKKTYRVIIDYRDESSIEERANNWCDVYAKINFNEKELTNPRSLSKIINIPPGFSINLWGFWKTTFFCFRNIICSRYSLPVSLKRHLGYYYLQLKKPNTEEYQPGKSKKDYVFSISTLWSYKSAVMTNSWRKNYVEECLSNEKIEFEGGFYATPTNPNYEKYKNLVFSKRFKIREYLSKTKKSALVFNTPAVQDCHGWKLGEYLAMGKAIVSTPLKNEIPFGLVHGKAIHFIENASQIKPAMNKIISDDEYRNKLEQGAYEYYLNHGAPIKVIKQVYDFLKKH